MTIWDSRNHPEFGTLRRGEATELAIDFDEWALECEKTGGTLNLSADEQRKIANTLREANKISKEDRDRLLQKLRDRNTGTKNNE